VSAKYLLPCRCGRQIVVEPREAGQTSSCPCGQSLLIPTMLEMTGLEPAPTETIRPAERAWRWQHGIVFLGGAMLLLAIGLGTYFHWNRPVAPIDAIDPEAVRQSANKLSPLQTWHYWELMKQGLDRRVDQRYAEKISLYHIAQGFAGALALAGMALIGCGVAIDKKRRGGKKAGRPGEKPMA
jgi:hypothetical protein